MHLFGSFACLIVFKEKRNGSLAVFCCCSAYSICTPFDNYVVPPEYLLWYPRRNIDILMFYFFQQPITCLLFQHNYFFMTVFFKYFYGKYMACKGELHLCSFYVCYMRTTSAPPRPTPPFRTSRDRGLVRGLSTRA